MILHHPEDRKIKVKLNGVASSQIVGSTFSVTTLDADFWIAWKAAYRESPLLLSHAIFEVKNEAEAAAKSKELRKELTGFEQARQNILGVEKLKSADA